MKILFMCVANSARSQMAEGLAREAFPDAEIESAGSNPGKLSPYAVTVMKEVGVDISFHRSKGIEDLSQEFIHGLDYVVTLCAEEVCPTLPTKGKRLHWPMPDPFSASEQETLKRFRDVRDSIALKLKTLKP